jgi:flagellar motor protein MotB
MQVTEDQKQAIGEWIQSGADLSKIQQSLKEEFGLNLTYLDTRFLLGDLGLEVRQEEEEEEEEEEETDPEESISEEQDLSAISNKEEPEAKSEEEEPLPEDLEAEADDENENQPTNVNLTVDSLTQPQCVISGKVTFSDGKGAAWYIDQLGRLGLNPDEEGYNPTQEDLAVFQTELRNVLSKEGL